MKRKYLYISVLILIILIITILILVQYKSGNLGIYKNSKDSNLKADVNNVISYALIDNTGEYLKTVVTIKKDTPIESIQYTDVDNKVIKLQTKNKNIVAIDLSVKAGEDMPFKIVSNGVEETQILNIPLDYINNYITLSKDDTNSTEQKYLFITNYNTDLQNEPIKNYYKIGNRTNWTEYTNNININVSDMNDFTNGQTTIYFKEETQNGEKIVREYVENVPLTGDFEIFRNALANIGEDPTKYDITCTEKTNCESYWFQLGQMGGGHGTDGADYSATFKINFKSSKNILSTIQPSEIEVGYVLFANSGSGLWGSGTSTSAAIATIYYTDGTTDQQTTGQKCWGKTVTGNLTFSIDSSKEISYITLNIKGHDASYSSSNGYFTGVTLKDCDFSNSIIQP